MGKYLDSFRKHLKAALDSNLISKAELHRKTGISLSMLYRYLENAEPGLHTLELIADALNTNPLELIKLQNEPLKRSHTVDECLLEISMGYEDDLLIRRLIFPHRRCPLCGEKVNWELKKLKTTIKLIGKHFCKTMNGKCTVTIKPSKQ